MTENLEEMVKDTGSSSDGRPINEAYRIILDYIANGKNAFTTFLQAPHNVKGVKYGYKWVYERYITHSSKGESNIFDWLKEKLHGYEEIIEQARELDAIRKRDVRRHTKVRHKIDEIPGILDRYCKDPNGRKLKNYFRLTTDEKDKHVYMWVLCRYKLARDKRDIDVFEWLHTLYDKDNAAVHSLIDKAEGVEKRLAK